MCYNSAYILIGIISISLCTTSLPAETQQNTSAGTQQKPAAPVKITNNPKLGEILTDSKGMTLYIFTADKENVSNCYDQCEALWPPLVVEKPTNGLKGVGGGKFGVIKRRDNKLQLTYNGKPLYYYANDKKPGDTNGQNVQNEWFVVHPNNMNH